MGVKEGNGIRLHIIILSSKMKRMYLKNQGSWSNAVLQTSKTENI